MKHYMLFAALMLATGVLSMYFGLKLPTCVALVILILAAASDYYTTWKCLKKGGKEANPVIAFLFKHITVPGTFGLTMCFWVWFIIFRWLPTPETSQTGVALMYLLVPLNNMMVMRRLRKRK